MGKIYKFYYVIENVHIKCEWNVHTVEKMEMRKLKHGLCS